MQFEHEQYENKLRHLGYEKLGGGLYSNVYAKPNSDRVVKIGRADCWPDYACWLIENGYSGTFGPKIYSLKFHGDFYVASMERLVDTISSIESHYGFSRCQLAKNDLWQLYQAVRNWLGDYNGDDLPQVPDFKEFIEKLDLAGLTGDLYGGNVMIRKDGSLVVTDPSARYSDSRFRIKNGNVTYLD